VWENFNARIGKYYYDTKRKGQHQYGLAMHLLAFYTTVLQRGTPKPLMRGVRICMQEQASIQV
jgi:ferric iron reductase protein FhuF